MIIIWIWQTEDFDCKRSLSPSSQYRADFGIHKLGVGTITI